ncbi:MAG: hypothetical protein LLG02_05610 [Pelosinus sp.]|nr:hypothetical protein [Pelosinus sp.]
MRKINAKFNTAFLSEAGSKLQNKDYFAFAEMDDFACYVIADGIDDDIEQESAKIAVASIIRQFSEKPSITKRSIKNWLKNANQELLALSKSMRLKASVTVLVTDYASMVYGMAGNSRLRLYREGTLIHQTRDHSLSNELMEQGKIPKDKVASHLERHNLHCYLGQPDGFNPEISSRIKLVEGDSIALFTRGIWENIDDGEIVDAISDVKEPQEFLNNVEDMLLSRQPSKLENYTLVAIFVDKTFQDPGRRKKIIRKMLLAAIPVAIVVAGLLLFVHVSQAHRQQEADGMYAHFNQAQVMSEQENFYKAVDEYKAAWDLSQKLKLPQEESNFKNYYQTASAIVAADTALQKKEFGKALEKYKDARAASYYADKLGDSYISKQEELTMKYVKIMELFQKGDQKFDQKDFMGARMSYLEAKVIASSLFYEEGRKEAVEQLAKIDAELAKADGQVKEDGKKAKEQEAFVYEQQGEQMARKGDNQGAISMLSMASGIYAQAGKNDKAIALQQRIAAIEDKMTVAEKAALQERITAEAEQYEEQGDRLLGQGDNSGAAEQYGLALSLYKQSGNKEKAALVQTKINNINKQQQNEENYATQRRAMDMEKEGDLEAAKGNFEEAKNCYNFAMSNYGAAGLANNVSIVQKKIDALDQKQTDFEQQKTKAAGYVADGDAKTKTGEFAKAKYLYVLANDIYIKLGLSQEKEQVDQKIKLADKLAKSN